MKVLVISASPREDGNSHLLAEAACAGAQSAGHDVEHVFLDEYVDRMLDNCRRCRMATGFCSLDDRYETLLLDKMLPADGIVYAMPLYFYGMPARLKTVFDRLFCYTANSAPQQEQVVGGITDKTVGVLISCEESYVGATAGVIAQFQELTRYLDQCLAGVVVGNANSRGEITCDPSDPISRAQDLGARLFDIRVTDYRLTTMRSNKVWDPVGC
ncbi:flavodoxin family protein [Mycobacterium aquaticum]|uniref:NAD(P)H dehydrogenase n=1 Tax=Mycobacterium aquaticum TaxID=1927124 RepID=A0A1X0BCY3_9MYCO|nr:flavodoxin family protein [Mycobacterium aquaticum]ORA40049.1 NAD(P)H dehydrogenase [Mycobacterium aquaticum]